MGLYSFEFEFEINQAAILFYLIKKYAQREFHRALGVKANAGEGGVVEPSTRVWEETFFYVSVIALPVCFSIPGFSTASLALSVYVVYLGSKHSKSHIKPI
jgi:hypothetical protein